MMNVGDTKGPQNAQFFLGNNVKIVTATLWPIKGQNKLGGVEIAFDNGKTPISCKCGQLGDPVKLDVKSGECYGITGRSSGSEIVALGFYFI